MLGKLLLFLFTLPLLVALGHDAYLYYEDQTFAEEKKGFQFATIGYTWNRYEKQSLREFMRPLDDEQREMAAFMLGQYNAVVGGVLSAIAFIVYGILRMLGGTIYKVHAMPVKKKPDRLARVMDRQKHRR